MRSLMVLLLLFSTHAYADGDYCPEGVNYTLEIVEDELWITHLYHPAFCKLAEGNTYNCTEKYVDGDVSKYTMEAIETPEGLKHKIDWWDEFVTAPLC